MIDYDKDGNLNLVNQLPYLNDNTRYRSLVIQLKDAVR